MCGMAIETNHDDCPVIYSGSKAKVYFIVRAFNNLHPFRKPETIAYLHEAHSFINSVGLPIQNFPAVLFVRFSSQLRIQIFRKQISQIPSILWSIIPTNAPSIPVLEDGEFVEVRASRLDLFGFGLSHPFLDLFDRHLIPN